MPDTARSSTSPPNAEHMSLSALIVVMAVTCAWFFAQVLSYVP